MEVILIIIAIITVILTLLFNKVIRSKNFIKQSESLIDIYLSKRYDTLLNMVNVVKGYASYESEVLKEVTDKRNISNLDLKQKAKLEKGIEIENKKLFAIAEAYPDLKADQHFLLLQKTIVDLEDELAASRRIYNLNVNNYNNLISIFPNIIFANLMKYKKIEYFDFDEVNND